MKKATALKKAKEELEDYFYIKYFTLDTIQKKIDMYKEQLECKTTMVYDDMPHSKYKKSTSKVETILDKINYYQDLYNDNVLYMKFIDETINSMSKIESSILFNRFIEREGFRMTDKELCKKLKISIATLYRHQHKSLERFALISYGRFD